MTATPCPIDAAIRAVPPLWPLDSFVAVNPYLGFSGQPFAQAAAEVTAATGARMTAPRAHLAEAIASGQITAADLAEAGAIHGLSVEALRKAALAAEPARSARPTLVDHLGPEAAGDVLDSISAFAAAWFDRGQAGLATLAQTMGLYAAWRAEQPDSAELPDTAEAVFSVAQERLGVPDAAWPGYLVRLNFWIAGWAGHARYKLWQAELYGRTDGDAHALLAVRLACELRAHARGLTLDWSAFAAEPAAPDAADLALQAALEAAYHRELARDLARGRGKVAAQTRPDVQAAFCIDVRSEVFRRALEATAPGVETIGFAGFFGAPLQIEEEGITKASDQCPVLLTPAYRIKARPAQLHDVAGRSIWKGFRQAAVSSIGYIETLGLSHAFGLAQKALGAAETPRAPLAGLETDPTATTGIPLGDRAGLAAGILRGMSLSKGMAPLVVLLGHGSTSANNPHASGLDCGACGGHTGEANARVVAALLNDPEVREDLPALGLEIPKDTLFLAGLHDTTTDEVTLYDLPAGRDLGDLRAAFARAGALARAERAARLPDAAGHVDAGRIMARARDWSQTRPEWGLAGCAAFIAAPRGRTSRLDLQGRSFLHSYDWQADEGFGVLELIMTAPLVVASWINLQYYGSSVDNRVFGSGNKVLHNIVGQTIGVLEGNAGDLRSGLPLQSVHDGARLVHDPLRLTAVIEAPQEAITDVLRRHPGLRDLFDNGWLHLFRMDGSGALAERYAGDLTWEAIVPTKAAA